ncbi:jerky protein homolog-like [Osmia bicornis bicornis]|uniref:jerky protein homolog-like n=1 Tax=Osmia bicornis bicornis TaxID=1437191 RepID=UPI001EAF5F03|nr:jerky protein homolog-like [Osmia bicornis bicornis]
MSWVSNFKRRHNIRLVSVCGEKASADTNLAESFIQYFQRHIEEEDIDIENVYNMDESGLFWKALPIKTLSTEKNVAGFKMKKDRITFGLCANVTGTNKIKPLVVHKHKKPRALKHSLHRLPVCYKSQKNAWVDREIFQDWYEQHFKPSVREYQIKKGITGKVVLLLDNCASHQVPLSEDDDTFSVKYLPPNTPALLQPMDQGVILKTKRIFQNEMCRSILTYEGGVNEFYANYNIKDCIDILIQAWGEVTPENIRHSWHKIIPASLRIQSYFRNESEDDGLEDAISVISDEQISQQQATIFLNTCRIEEEEVPQSDADNQDSNNESEQDSDNEDEHNIQSPQEQIKYKLQCLKYHIMRASCLTTELQDLSSS